MQSIEFGRDRYFQHTQMETWCKENLGIGGWVQCYHSDDWVGIRSWSMESQFGRVIFRFKNDADATFFAMHWK